MQSVTNIGNESDGKLVTAQALREMTVSKDELVKRQKNSLLDDLMSSMVKIATEQGNNAYGVSLNPQFDPVLLSEIVTELTTLGYTVTSEAKTTDKMGSFIALNIGW